MADDVGSKRDKRVISVTVKPTREGVSVTANSRSERGTRFRVGGVQVETRGLSRNERRKALAAAVESVLFKT
jgi:hypothetical protein